MSQARGCPPLPSQDPTGVHNMRIINELYEYTYAACKQALCQAVSFTSHLPLILFFPFIK